jgi:hypothetical protein
VGNQAGDLLEDAGGMEDGCHWYGLSEICGYRRRQSSCGQRLSTDHEEMVGDAEVAVAEHLDPEAL